MKYILRTLWLIGYIPVCILTGACFLIMTGIYPLIYVFYLIKKDVWEKIPIYPESLAVYIDDKYRELLKYFN